MITNLHPLSIKSLKQGHLWITKDKFSEAFPKNKDIIELGDSNKKSLGYFLNDPLHPKVKARFLTHQKANLTDYIPYQIKKLIKLKSKLQLKRENFYLCFGEADSMAGLYIQRLNNHTLVQYHAFTWEKHLKQIVRVLRENSQGNFFWTQARIPGEQKKAPKAFSFENTNEAIINENEIKLKLKFDLNHDIGLYTDMSSLREKIAPYLENKKNVLNLFSYTGAFSLQALKNKSQVTSVDLSRTYMSWLEENIEINEDIDSNLHASIIQSCSKMLTKSEETFDCIICDPPSFSSNGKKRESSFDFYKKNWSLLWERLSPNGHIIVFLNTHSIKREKFRKLLNDLLKNKGKKVKELQLGQDCSIIPKFSESDYLKGFVIQKHH